MGAQEILIHSFKYFKLYVLSTVLSSGLFEPDKIHVLKEPKV